MFVSNSTPIPTFPLRGKEILILQKENHPLPLRGGIGWGWFTDHESLVTHFSPSFFLAFGIEYAAVVFTQASKCRDFNSRRTFG